MSKNNNITQQQSSFKKIPVDRLSFCELLGVHPDTVEHFNIRIDSNSFNRIIDVTLKPTYQSCPNCGSTHPNIKGYYTKTLPYTNIGINPTYIKHKVRRYQCKLCGITYSEPSPFHLDGFKISLPVVMSVLEHLKDPNITFQKCAELHNISNTSVAYIFDNHVKMQTHKLPEYICMDEVYAGTSKKSKYICVLLDYKTKNPIDVLPSRKKVDLEKYFIRIPIEERDSVRVICTDMYDPYRLVIKDLFPYAIHVIDRFHVAQDLNRQVDRFRIKIMNQQDKNSVNYYLLKHFNFLLFHELDDLLDPNRKRKYNYKLKRYLNYYEVKDLLLAIDPRLEEVVNLKDRLSLFYDNYLISENVEVPKVNVPEQKFNKYGKQTKKSIREREIATKWNQKETITLKQAHKILNDLILDFTRCEIEEIQQFARTLLNWENEIINGIRVYKEVSYKNINNAIIENRNKIIKNIKHASNGYKNFERFRNRILYSLRNDSTYRLTPIEEQLYVKRLRNKRSYDTYIKQKKRNKSSH